MIRVLSSLLIPTVLPLALLPCLLACTDKGGGNDPGLTDGGSTDGGSTDGGSSDGGSSDGGSSDGGSSDGGSSDGGSSDGGDGGASPELELWLYMSANLQVTDDLPALYSVLERATASGYTGVVLADFKTSLLHTGTLADWYDDNLSDFLATADGLGLDVMPAVLPFGYSEGILRADPNLAEGRLVQAGLQVQPDGSLVVDPAFGGLSGGGFEAGDLTGWSWADHGRVSVDDSEAATGRHSVRIDAGSDNARVVQQVDVAARQQLHLSFALKSTGWSGSFNAMLYETTTGRSLSYGSYDIASTQDWTVYDLIVHTGDLAEGESVSLYLGLWGSSTGTLWVDSVALEETAFVNLIRRAGAPLTLVDGAGRALSEPTDVETIIDPLAGPDGIFDDWHEAPTVQTGAGSSLSTGDRVTVSYYAVAPVYSYQVGACLTDPDGHSWVADNLAAVAGAYPYANRWFPQYDEMRHGYSCAGCRATGLGAGGLLAWHVEESVAAIEAVVPAPTLYFWSDMFDPTHNAVADYYFVEGDYAGSWTGLPSDAIIMNWSRTADSLAWFESLGHEQILAGFYDSHSGAAAAASDVAVATGVEGVRSFMYTTWTDDYSQLEAYAEVLLDAFGDGKGE